MVGKFKLHTEPIVLSHQLPARKSADPKSSERCFIADEAIA